MNEVEIGFKFSRSLLALTYDHIGSAHLTQKVFCIGFCKLLFYIRLETHGYGLDKKDVHWGFVWPKKA